MPGTEPLLEEQGCWGDGERAVCWTTRAQISAGRHCTPRSLLSDGVQRPHHVLLIKHLQSQGRKHTALQPQPLPGLSQGSLGPLGGGLQSLLRGSSRGPKWRQDCVHRSGGHPLHLGEECASPGDMRACADPRAAGWQGARAQLAAGLDPGEQRVPLLRAVLSREPDIQSAGGRRAAR